MSRVDMLYHTMVITMHGVDKRATDAAHQRRSINYRMLQRSVCSHLATWRPCTLHLGYPKQLYMHSGPRWWRSATQTLVKDNNTMRHPHTSLRPPHTTLSKTQKALEKIRQGKELTRTKGLQLPGIHVHLAGQFAPHAAGLSAAYMSKAGMGEKLLRAFCSPISLVPVGGSAPC